MRGRRALHVHCVSLLIRSSHVSYSWQSCSRRRNRYNALTKGWHSFNDSITRPIGPAKAPPPAHHGAKHTDKPQRDVAASAKQHSAENNTAEANVKAHASSKQLSGTCAVTVETPPRVDVDKELAYIVIYQRRNLFTTLSLPPVTNVAVSAEANVPAASAKGEKGIKPSSMNSDSKSTAIVPVTATVVESGGAAEQKQSDYLEPSKLKRNSAFHTDLTSRPKVVTWSLDQHSNQGSKRVRRSSGSAAADTSAQVVWSSFLVF